LGNGGILSSFGLNSLDPVSNAVGRQRRETVRAFWAKEFKARRIFVSGSWNLTPRRFAIGIMECWNNRILGFHSTSLKNIARQEIKKITDRKNIKRGFKELRVWQDAVSLYILACEVFSDFPFELKKVAANSIDAAQSISKKISEGYCRPTLKEYLNYRGDALLNHCSNIPTFHCCMEVAKADGVQKTNDYDGLYKFRDVSKG
jgi:hypothetical protein